MSSSSHPTSEEQLFQSIQGKARADAVYDMTIEELIAWWGAQRYTPIGQATLNHLERLYRLENSND